jgi:hypothetical protein
VYDSCIELLLGRGFRVAAELDVEENLEWVASFEGYRFVATNPLELLGLAAMHVFVGPTRDEPYWWNVGRTAHVARLRREAEDQAAPMLALAREAAGPERVRTALRAACGRRDEAAAALGLTEGQLVSLFAAPGFDDLEIDGERP